MMWWLPLRASAIWVWLRYNASMRHNTPPIHRALSLQSNRVCGRRRYSLFCSASTMPRRFSLSIGGCESMDQGSRSVSREWGNCLTTLGSYPPVHLQLLACGIAGVAFMVVNLLIAHRIGKNLCGKIVAKLCRFARIY